MRVQYEPVYLVQPCGVLLCASSCALAAKPSATGAAVAETVLGAVGGY